MAKLPTVAPFTRRLVLCGAGVVLQPDAPRSVYYQGSQQLSPSQGRRLQIWTVMVKKAILWFANAELIEAIYSDRGVWLGPLWYCGADGEPGWSCCSCGRCSRKLNPQRRGSILPLIWGVQLTGGVWSVCLGWSNFKFTLDLGLRRN